MKYEERHNRGRRDESACCNPRLAGDFASCLPVKFQYQVGTIMPPNGIESSRASGVSVSSLPLALLGIECWEMY
jgi:hypothetical protein